MQRKEREIFAEAKVMVIKMNYNVKLSDEVREALALGRPVIALESTIIAHGMPYPQNVKTALACERLARTHGAVPATIAIIGGQLCAGLTEEQIEYLGRGRTECCKSQPPRYSLYHGKGCGRCNDGCRNDVHCKPCGHKKCLQRAASAACIAARKQPWIFPADLTELGRTPVAVVCAGAKSVLDIGLTLEYLETQGVPVVGFRTNKKCPHFTRGTAVITPLADAIRLRSFRIWSAQWQIFRCAAAWLL